MRFVGHTKKEIYFPPPLPQEILSRYTLQFSCRRLQRNLALQHSTHRMVPR
jgi:hypothetical protein